MPGSDPTQHDPTWQEIDDEARQRRIEALRDIASHTLQAPANAATRPAQAGEAPRPSLAPPPHHPGRSSHPRTRWLGASALVLAIFVVAVFALTRLVGASTIHQAATPAPRNGPLVIRPAVDALACPTAAAWSDDGTKIAVLGNASCLDDPPGPGMLNVYNVPSGKLVAKVQLDDVTKRALGAASTSGVSGLLITYTHVLWLGPAIYVTIRVTREDSSGFRATLPFVGLLRVNPSDQQLVAYVQPNHGGTFAVYMRWNPTAGSVQITRDAIVSSHGDISASLPPSLAYGWGEGGNPIVLTPLFAGPGGPPDPGGPVGVPSSGSRLTIWQPGFVTYTTGQGATGVYIFSTDFAAVSDGQPFLFDAVRLVGVLVPSGQPAPDRKSLAALHLLPAPWLPVRDAALQAVMDGLPALTVVAWRPDGAVLAAHASIPFDQNGQPTATDITFYDTATGHVLGTVKPPGAISHTVNPLLWAPDGRALLMLNQEASTLVIWTQEQLPH